MVIRDPIKTSQAQFELLINAPENADKWFEMLSGIVYEVVMPTPIHAFIGSLIYRMIANFLDLHPLGFAYADGCMFYLPNGDNVIPDAAFVSKERLPFVPARYDLAPDLAVEVISPSNKPDDMLLKIESYIECGTQLVWAVYPEEKLVRVWRPDGKGRASVQKLDLSGVLDGEDVLPGFSLAVKDIFPVEA
ncbi:MAG: Uma2 family endonuclease [Chloroflexi bacterium]|nr:Uma2 family endonuclease [Chloroflexota bacterium]MCC6894913.1 Uma2 family endonuclease [Anaerolineae bacterium]